MFKSYRKLYHHSGLNESKLLKKSCGRIVFKNDFFRKTSKVAASAMLAVSVAACGGGDNVSHKPVKKVDMSNRITGYVGSVSADEPQAAMLAREILVRGGNAADAAAALGFALTITLPSRASLGGGGACIAYKSGSPAKSILFLPQSGNLTGNVDRPAAIPMMARGLYLLQAGYGQADINDILQMVGNLAQKGITVSDAFASDLSALQGPLLADPAMAKIFTRSDGSILQAGDILYQPRLKIIYDRMQSSGIADLYIGSLARSYAMGAQAAGGGLTLGSFRNALPVEVPSLVISDKNSATYFIAPPADGGLGMAMAWKVANGQYNAVAQGTVANWRAKHQLVFDKKGTQAEEQEAQNLVDHGIAGNGSLPQLPASTSFSVVDRNGGAVSCALTMNNLFGTGRIAGTTGIVMAAAPNQYPQPLLTAAITTYRQRFVAAVAASGQNEAAGAAAEVLNTLLNAATSKGKTVKTIAHPSTPQGRVNAVYCADGVNEDQCRAYTDPNGTGLGISH